MYKESIIRCLDIVLSICFIILGSALFFSIISYDIYDPSFLNAKGGTEKIHNFLGNIGARYADPILQSVGYTVFLPICVFLIIGIKKFFRRNISYFFLRFISLLIVIICLSSILTFFSNDIIDQNLGFGLGGVLGEYVKQILLEYFKYDHILIGLFTTLLIFGNFSFCISFSEWRSIIYYLYKWILNICMQLNRLLHKLSKQKTVLTDEKKIKSKPLNNVVKTAKENILHDEFSLPDVNLLKNFPSKNNLNASKMIDVKKSEEELLNILSDYGVNGNIINHSIGPVVTLYEFEPEAGTKASKVISLADDVARSMSAISTRISTIPGRNALGIEIPNEKRETIYLKELIDHKDYENTKCKLPLVLGQDITGKSIIVDLSKMPHLLIAGTTGSGKSVAINTMILSLLYSCTIKECRLVMIDPKMLELSVYDGIPHLLSPVVTDPKKAVEALRWVVQEMEKRYRAMASFGVRNIAGFNDLIIQHKKNGQSLKKTIHTGFDEVTGEAINEEVDFGNEPLPYIVVIVDEMADLMLVAGKEIESYIQRIAQMARASGIHLIMATQRPSVDVITGVIKANFPTRISFQVTSKIDSRTILGEQGAEQLLGMGDMLYMSGGMGTKRVHGPFVSDTEVEDVVKELKKNNEKFKYEINFNLLDPGNNTEDMRKDDLDVDDLYQKAVAVVRNDNRPTTSYVQRRLRIGYNKAASLIEQMEEEGVVTKPNSQGKREIID
jgi:S-DNA-T family DNA segregation ATPase FtsK/SpoIIIE